MPNAILGSPAGGLEEPDLASHRTNTTMSYQADRPFTLYFVRHGITEPNFRGFRCGGVSHLSVMDIRCDQAHLLSKQIEALLLAVGVIPRGSALRQRQTAAV